MPRTSLLIIFSAILAASYICAAAESQDSQEIQAHYLRGNIYYQNGKYKEAQKEYNLAIELANGQGPKSSVLNQPYENQFDKNDSKISGSAVSESSKSEVKAFSGIGGEYIIGQDDGLHVSVWQNPDLEKDVTVRPDGKISYPLIGDILARGLSIPELGKVITDKLKDYVKFPQVSVSLSKIGGERVMIFGQVGGPGIYSVTGGKTIMELIGMAGGFARDSVPSSTMLIRGGLSSPKVRRINLSRVFQGDLSQNIVLQSQDIIFVPRKFIADINYFLEQVLSPLRQGTSLRAGYNANMTW